MKYSHISVAIPMLAELDNLPKLTESLQHQGFSDFTVYCCVNNPEEWAESDNGTERAMFLNNQDTLEYLKNYQFKTLDRSSVGRGWQGKQRGVGWARKELFDTIARNCDDDELIVSLDADTDFGTNYLQTILETMNLHPDHSALAVPYYHPLSGNENEDRAMLRYEIYMRHYLLNLMESNNLYAFTALGSAMVFPLWAYKRVGGITPLQGGEDFYLLQKFAKTGKLLLSCNEVVKPQGRASNRVPFGTGPAVAKGVENMDELYPLYPREGFQAVADTFSVFPKLYDADLETPMTSFLCQQLKTDSLWQPLRKNFKTRELFVHACKERVDGLRILQYLKNFPRRTAEEELCLFCNIHGISVVDGFSFLNSPIYQINSLRDSLFELEQLGRRKMDC